MNKRQHGVTMVEMLISLLMSTLLIGGVGSLFVQMQKSNKLQSANSYMMDDARYVTEILQKEIRRTGGLRSRTDSLGDKNHVFLQDDNLFGVATLDFAEGQAIAADTTAGVTNDSFVIRYQLNDANDLSPSNPTNSSSTCTQDLALTVGDDPAVQVHVVTVYFYVSAGNLMCQSKRQIIDANGKVVLTTVPAGTPVPASLIGNLQQLKALYGVDSTNDYAADYYTTADLVTVAFWDNVISVQLSLVLKSEEDKIASTNTSYTVNGVTTTASDKRIYRVFGTSIGLRNLLLK